MAARSRFDSKRQFVQLRQCSQKLSSSINAMPKDSLRTFRSPSFGESVPFSRIVHLERMHLPDPTPDNHIVTTFEKETFGTLMIMRMTLPDTASRAAMLATGMEHGMEASYVRLDALVRSYNSCLHLTRIARCLAHHRSSRPRLRRPPLFISPFRAAI